MCLFVIGIATLPFVVEEEFRVFVGGDGLERPGGLV
jgi:hypothetical protein